MPRAKTSARPDAKETSSGRVPLVPRESAGKWIAWSADGRHIIAVGDTFKACEQAAARAGYPANQVAIDRVPRSRQRTTGSGM